VVQVDEGGGELVGDDAAVFVAGGGVERTAVVVADGDREGVQVAGEQCGAGGAERVGPRGGVVGGVGGSGDGVGADGGDGPGDGPGIPKLRRAAKWA
jgi:hypothetical protein